MQFPLKSFLFFILALSSLIARSQQPAFRNYSVDNGLPSSEIFHIIQDKKGYIWMATNMGVSRFDGRNFVNYDVQNGLPENTVFEIYEDESDRLWFISFPFQLSYFYHDSIYKYKYNDTLESIAGHGMIPVKRSFHADSKGNVIFSFLNDGKIYRINNDGKLKILKEIDNSASVSIIESDGKLFGAQSAISNLSGNFILQLAISTHLSKYLKLEKPGGKFAFGNFMMQSLPSGQLLFAQNELLTVINKDVSYVTYDIKDRILWLSSESDTSIWIGKESTGVERFSIIDGKSKEQYLDGVAISSVMIDSEGGKWFTSLGSGVYYLASKAFVSYSMQDGLSGKNVQSVELYKGNLFIGSDNYVLDKLEEGKIKHVKSFFYDDVKSINLLRSFNEQNLYISAKTVMYSYDGQQFIEYENNHNTILNSPSYRKKTFSIKDIYPIGPNEVLMAQMKSITSIKNMKVVYDSYMDHNMALRIESIEKESDSAFLLGTFNGLYRYINTRFIYLGNKHDLLKNRITAVKVLKNQKGSVLGTKGIGLIVNLPDTIFQITNATGLSSNSISSILITGNDLWVATNNGLNLLKLDELRSENPKIIVFKKENGLISNEINQIKGDSNFIYIATNGGLTIFDRRKYHPFINPPPVYIHGVNIMDQSTAIKPDYDLSYDQNFIRIAYAGICFRDAGDLLYKYKLFGLSNDKWVFTKNIEVEYAFLPPGTYKFEVYAINSEGLISSKPAIINFIIHPPFWKTWWFKTLMVILFLILAAIAVKARMEQIKKKHEMQNDIIRYRQQSLLRQMDPHFVFNTLNSIQSFIIKNESKVATIYISKFSRLMRLILTNSQKQTVRLSNEINALNLYLELESMRFKERFEYSITLDPVIEPDICFIPAFIVQPFIENAIWHGIMPLEKAGRINVNFEKDGEQLIFTVEDNGVGRDIASRNKSDVDKGKESLGISIVETRLELLSQFYGVQMGISFTDLVSEEQLPIGTRVAVNLPIVQ